jgi:hypothetical protein
MEENPLQNSICFQASESKIRLTGHLPSQGASDISWSKKRSLKNLI